VKMLTRALAVGLTAASLLISGQAAWASGGSPRHVHARAHARLVLWEKVRLVRHDARDLEHGRTVRAAMLADAVLQLVASLPNTGSVAGEVYVGTVAATSTSGLSVTLLGGNVENLALAPDAQVFLNARPSALPDLAVGDRVVVVLDKSGEALFVAARGENANAPAGQVEGTVVSVTATSITVAPLPGEQQGQREGNDQGSNDQGSVSGSVYGQGGSSSAALTTYTFASGVVVRYHGQSLAVSDLAAGDQVHLWLDQAGEVTAVDVQRLAATVSGTVEAVFHGRLLIQDASGTLMWVRLTPKTAVNGTIGVGVSVTVSGYFTEGGLTATSVMVSGAGG
jgi:hypothetical protein